MLLKHAVLLLAALTLAPSRASAEVGVDEHLGATVPPGLVFRDERGKPIRLGAIADRPTILCLVYYRCPGICSPLMNGLVEALDKVNLEPGRDYRVISVSFVPTETPDLAASKKANYMAAFHRPFPADAWRFLTGARGPIDELTRTVGFNYEPDEGGEWAHPGVLVILSPEGKIVRYMTGLSFLPFDVHMALLEAKAGRISPGVRKALLYCYRYDPSKQSYSFNIMRVAGTAAAAGVFLVVGVLIYTARRRRND